MMIPQNLFTLDEIKNNHFLHEQIIWDLEPRQLMEPRCSITKDGKKYREPIKGYVFYIDTLSNKPTLFLMRHSSNDIGATCAVISEIPQELITEALEENKNKGYFGMFPINSKIKDWLIKEMSLKNPN